MGQYLFEEYNTRCHFWYGIFTQIVLKDKLLCDVRKVVEMLKLARGEANENRAPLKGTFP